MSLYVQKKSLVIQNKDGTVVEVPALLTDTETTINQFKTEVNQTVETVSSKVTALETAKNTLQTNLSNEISRATQAESTLTTTVQGIRTDLTAETTRATTAEAGLRSSITAEQERATTAETEINDALSQLENDINNSIDLFITGEVIPSLFWSNRALNNNGIPSVNSNIRISSNLVRIKPKTEYYIKKNDSNTSVAIFCFDHLNNKIEVKYAKDSSFIKLDSSTCSYIRILAQYNDNSEIYSTNGNAIVHIEAKYIFNELEDIKEEIKNFSDVIIKETHTQIFDRKQISIGFMNTSGGVDSTSTGYVHTEKIDVSKNEGDTIYFSIDGLARGIRFLCAFDKNYNPIPAKGINDGKMDTVTYTVQSGVEYIVITYQNPSIKSEYAHFQAEYGKITGYNEYGYTRNINMSLIDNYSFYKLNKKKWVVCGDSFTAGVMNTVLESGKYKGQKKIYPYFIGNRTGIDVVNFFGGGRTLAYPSGGNFENSLTNPSASFYYQNIPIDADYITIYLGINDSNHRYGSGTTVDGEDATGVIPIGTIDDTDTSTYGGAWNVVLSWLLQNRPFAHIGIIVTNGCANSDYRDLQIAIARKYGIPFIDLNGDDRTPVMIRSQNPNISPIVKTIILHKQAVDYDGSKTGNINTHPNDYAHEYESHFIENFLLSL